MSTSIHPADAAQAHAITQSRASNETEIIAINDGYSRFVGYGKRTVEILIAQANEARRIGMHLAGLKRNGKGFSRLFTVDSNGRKNNNPAVMFSQKHGCFFMRLAAAYPEEITSLAEAVTSLKDLMVAANELPESSRGDQRSRGTLNWLSTLQKQLMTATAIIGKQLDKADMRAWSRTEVEIMERHLRPFADRHRAAAEILRSNAAQGRAVPE